MLNPTQRAQRAMQKLKEREQRRIERSSPGPGAYDLSKRKASSSEVYCGARAFKSKTLRNVAVGPEPLRDKELNLDPGSYEPNSHRDLAVRSKHTFAKSAQKGANQFGSRAARGLELKITGEESPSPTEYGGGGAKPGMSDVVAASKIKCWAFTTTSNQRIALQGKEEKDKPAPGAYNASDAGVQPKVRNAGVDFRSKSQRFNTTMLFDKGLTTGEHLGPGHYAFAEKHQTLSRSRELAKALGLNAFFRSESVRDISSAFFAREKTGF